MNWVEERSKWAGVYSPSEYDWQLAKERVAARKEAYADTLMRVVFDEIQRGETDGSYSMDGRKFPVPSATEAYFVGGAGPCLLVPPNVWQNEYYFKSAIEVLRSKISELESISNDPLYLGTWESGGDIYLDISNCIASYRDMAATMAARPLEQEAFDAMNIECIKRADINYQKAANDGYKSQEWQGYQQRRHEGRSVMSFKRNDEIISELDGLLPETVILFTDGLAYRGPATHNKPITVADAKEIVLTYGGWFEFDLGQDGEYHLNHYNGNDMF